MQQNGFLGVSEIKYLLNMKRIDLPDSGIKDMRSFFFIVRTFMYIKRTNI